MHLNDPRHPANSANNANGANNGEGVDGGDLVCLREGLGATPL